METVMDVGQVPVSLDEVLRPDVLCAELVVVQRQLHYGAMQDIVGTYIPS